MPSGHQADGEQRAGQPDLPEQGGAEQPEGAGRGRASPPSAPEPHGPPAARPGAQQVAHAAAGRHQLADGGHEPGQQVAAAERDHAGDGQRRESGAGRPGGRVDVHLPPHRHGGDPARRRAAASDRRPADAPQCQAGPDQAPHLVPVDVAVADRPERRHRAPGDDERADVPQVPRPRPERAPRPPGPPGDERARPPRPPTGPAPGDDGDQRRQPVRAEQHPHAVAGRQAGGRRRAAGAVGERLGVADPGGRGDDHPGARHPGPPGQAEVVAEERDRLVEAADLGEARRPHERERRPAPRTRRGAPSCWPWSSSPRSTNGRATPTLSTVMPNCGEAPRGVPLRPAWARRRRRPTGRPRRRGRVTAPGSGAASSWLNT